MPLNCPSEQELMAFHLGTLPEREVDRVADHLGACPNCEAAVVRFDTAVDPVLSALRKPRADTQSQQHPNFGPEAMPTSSPTLALDPDQPQNWPSLPGYEVLGPLGRGGMGVVYKARQVRLNRLVALKKLRSGEPREVARSRIEAEALARLQHPNIVQIFEIIDHQERAYLALELVEGGPLGAVLTGKPHPARETAALVESLTRAVHYAHGQGIVHRDLKPANVLLQIANCKLQNENLPQDNLQFAICNLQFAIPKIADFGLAKRLATDSGETREGDVLGTPAYMAPEQAGGKGETIGPATDVYSLGVILYKMLTGRVPLQGPTTLDTLILMRTEDPVPPRRLQPRITRDLETICLKCLEKKPAHRYASAADLADDLHHFLHSEPIRARPTPAWERGWKWARRRPLVAALTAAVVVIAALGFGLVAWQWRRAEEKAVAEAQARKQAQDNEIKEKKARCQVEKLASAEAAAKKDAQEKEAREKKARRKFQKLSAAMTLGQGTALCEKGELERGLLWLTRALELAHQAGDRDMESAARINLGGWQGLLVRARAKCAHTHWVWDVAFSPDNQTCVTTSFDGTARLWNVATGKPVGTPLVHSGPVTAVAFSPDGKLLLTGSETNGRGEARLWKAATGQLLKRRPPAQNVGITAVAFSRTGRTFLTVCPEQARLWRTEDCQPIGTPMKHPSPAQPFPFPQWQLTARFSQDGKWIATGGADGTARLWDAFTCKAKGEPLTTSGPVLALAFSPDSRTLLTGSMKGGAQMWDVATGRRRGPTLRHQGRVLTVAFSADGDMAATGGAIEEDDPETEVHRFAGGEVRLWRAMTGRPIGAPLVHRQPVWSMAFSPGGRILLAGCEDSQARFFLTATGLPMGQPLEHEGNVRAVAISPDGKAALTGAAGGDGYAAARLWQLPPEQALGRTFFGGGAPLSCVNFSPDGKALVTGSHDGIAQMWNVTTGRPSGPKLVQGGAAVVVALFSPDGEKVLTASEQGVPSLWDRATGRRRRQFGPPRPPRLIHHHWISSGTFTPDGRTILLTRREGLVEFWDAATGKAAGRPHQVKQLVLSTVAFSPDQRQILLGTTYWALLLDAKTRCLVRKCSSQPAGRDIFYPDGKKVLLIGEDFARIWDLASNRVIGAPRFHPKRGLYHGVFSPDGQSIIISSPDGFSRLWDVATGKTLGPPVSHPAGRPVAIDPKGRMLAAGGPDGRITLWPAPRRLGGTVERVRLWMEVLTGMELDNEAAVKTLGPAALRQRQRRLNEVGGPPQR
jgi:WD40 repeat protein